MINPPALSVYTKLTLILVVWGVNPTNTSGAGEYDQLVTKAQAALQREIPAPRWLAGKCNAHGKYLGQLSRAKRCSTVLIGDSILGLPAKATVKKYFGPDAFRFASFGDKIAVATWRLTELAPLISGRCTTVLILIGTNNLPYPNVAHPGDVNVSHPGDGNFRADMEATKKEFRILVRELKKLDAQVFLLPVLPRYWSYDDPLRPLRLNMESLVRTEKRLQDLRNKPDKNEPAIKEIEKKLQEQLAFHKNQTGVDYAAGVAVKEAVESIKSVEWNSKAPFYPIVQEFNSEVFNSGLPVADCTAAVVNGTTMLKEMLYDYLHLSQKGAEAFLHCLAGKIAPGNKARPLQPMVEAAKSRCKKWHQNANTMAN